MTQGGRLRQAIQRHPFSFRVGLGLVVLVASVVAIVLGYRPPPARAQPIEARVELASGEVEIVAASTKKAVISGTPLHGGDEIRTGKGARALLRLEDGSAAFLRDGARVRLGEGGMVLEEGELWLDAPPEGRGALVHQLGEVRVSAADAGLSMRRAGGEVVVYVTRGLSIMSSPKGRVELHAGEEATCTANAAPRVTPVAYWDDWTGGMGDHRPLAGEGSGAGRIYAVDRGAPSGSPARTLEISRQAVRAVVREGFAETEVDQTFSNPGGREVEGWYWFTVPERAVVTSFSVETNGALIEGEVIERKEAAQKYEAAARSAHAPALLEWIDGRSYRARIFPVPASGSRRVVLRYLEISSAREGKHEYLYPMRSAEPVRIGELKLTVDLGNEGVDATIATVADAIVEQGGRRVSMRRSGYVARTDFQLEWTPKKSRPPLSVARRSGGAERADYLMARYVPDVEWDKIPDLPADLVVAVDTSASTDDLGRKLKTDATEALLRALSPSDHFALVALDEAPTVLYPKEGLAEASDKEIASALTRLAERPTGGATDLGALFDVALGRVHGKEQPAVVYVGDGIATSGEVDAAQMVERLRRSMSTSRARLFTVAVGAGANHAGLGELARVGGGKAFRIDEAAETNAVLLRLTGAIKTPTITDLSIDLGAGLDEPMLVSSGRVSRGEEVLLFARTHHPLPRKAVIKGRLGGADFSRSYPIAIDAGVGATLLPRLWAAEKMRRQLGQASDLESARGEVVALGLEYGLVTPFTSILALESEEAYRRMGIPRRRSSLYGVRLSALESALLPAPLSFGMGCAKREAPTSDQAALPAPIEATPTPATPAQFEVPAADPVGANATDDDGTKNNEGDLDRQVAEAPNAQADTPAAPAPARVRVKIKADPDDPYAEEVEQEIPVKPAPPPPPPPSPPPPPREEKKREDKSKPKVLASACSDVARRPLAERIVLWKSRLRLAKGIEELIARYEGARATCELPDLRARAALLELLQAKIETPDAAKALLEHFRDAPEEQQIVARALLRRSSDAQITAVAEHALGSDVARWALIDNELASIASPAERLARLRKRMLASPEDPEGQVRLMRLLVEAGEREEAVSLGRRLRDQGLLSPRLSLALGDALEEGGLDDEAVRAYSEIVEFDPRGAASRRLLGDVYLRHGWYPAAYRQYTTLTEIAPADPLAWLRLSSAAAGSGRLDEALRIQRKVASSDGTPGPQDPRRWARLGSAALLTRLLSDESMEASRRESISRRLQELALFSGSGTLLIVTWEDYAAALSLSSFDGDEETSAGERWDASEAGMLAVLLPTDELSRLRWAVRWRGDPPLRGADFTVHTLSWDANAKTFTAKLRPGALPASEKETQL